jgi:hypothetical protein
MTPAERSLCRRKKSESFIRKNIRKRRRRIPKNATDTQSKKRNTDPFSNTLKKKNQRVFFVFFQTETDAIDIRLFYNPP